VSQRLSDYLTQETTDYLEQLDRLLMAPGSPDPDSLLRLARGVRGSAQMAGMETIAAVAERLEDAGRSVLSNNIIWSEEIRQLAIHTVRDLKVLVRALNRWGPAEEARVRAAILRWDEKDAPDPDPVPVSALFYDDAGPHVVGSVETEDGGDEVEGDPVPVDALLLRGEGALREALGLRPEIEGLLPDGAPGELRLRLAELFDLLELALSTAERPTG
jgi:HPt (histidine-containing phosphotransfer) domain-containing protein